MRTLRLLFAAGFLGGCASPTEIYEADLSVRVSHDGQGALAGVAISVEDAHVATSDALGEAHTLVSSSAPHARVGVACPAGYRGGIERTVPLARRGESAPALRLELACVPAQRTIALVVHAQGGSGLAVRADGVVLGRIEPDATAHFLLSRPPGSDVRLSIDTSERPELTPRDPSRVVRVSDRDEIVVFEQSFRVPEPRPTRTGRPSALPAPVRHVPYAIGPA
jgi:hypothetical protein